MIKKLTAVIIAVIVSSSVISGCHKSESYSGKKANKALTIAYDNSKYGDTWIKSITAEYKKINKDTEIKLVSDSNLTQKAANILKSDGNDIPDVMFISETNWQYWASKNYLYDLTDLYNTEIDSKKTLQQKIKPEYLNHCKYDGNYYIVPWDTGVAGFVYNKTMFEAHNWQVPTTMQDFFSLLEQIKAAGIIPVAWDGSDIGDWNYAVRTWWAQSEGRDNMNSYLALQSPEVYLQNGRTESLKLFERLTTDYTNNIDDVLNSDSNKAERLFYNSKAAMLLGGSWTEANTARIIPKDFRIGIMNFPAIDNAKDPNINVSVSGGFAAIPIKSGNKTLAKDFLRFTSTDTMLELYAKTTSSPRPFDFNFKNTSGLSDFGLNVMNIWDNGNFYMISDNPLYYNNFGDWPNSNATLLQIFSGQLSPEEAVKENYDYVKSNWK